MAATEQRAQGPGKGPAEAPRAQWRTTTQRQRRAKGAAGAAPGGDDQRAQGATTRTTRSRSPQREHDNAADTATENKKGAGKEVRFMDVDADTEEEQPKTWSVELLTEQQS